MKTKVAYFKLSYTGVFLFPGQVMGGGESVKCPLEQVKRVTKQNFVTGIGHLWFSDSQIDYVLMS